MHAACAILAIVLGASTVDGTSLEEIPEALRPSIKSWIEGGSEIGLGEAVVLRVVVTRRPADRIHLPADTSFGTLELVDKVMETREGEGGRVIDDYSLTLLALEPGETQIPGLEFGGVLEGGDVVHLDTHARKVKVTDPTAGAKDDVPKDIAPVVDVYQEDYTILYVSGGLLVLVLLVLLVRYLVMNWTKWHPMAALAPPPPRPPDEVALEKLEALREGGMPEKGLKKAWYIELSEIMREYVGGRYGFDGLESTTEEIIVVMRGRKTAGLTQAELFRFLNECDMVKFAKFSPGTGEDETALSEAFRIVQVTTPEKPTPRPGGKS
ncbi:MAG: hypothetical protein JRG91_06705 [Deltaproteobacteria bacterium]|nr:hypothetical protein [Deltaproteobacteria bacterium]